MDRPWRILKERLINKISVLVYPGIDGLAGVPSIFEFVGDANPRPAADQSPRHVARKH
jgi:5-amino-6-(5-phosphoribosylamino)uracil reductase